MNLLHALTARGARLAMDRTFGLDGAAGPLHLAAGVLVALPAAAAIHGLGLGRQILAALLTGAENHLGACAQCGAPVTKSDPFLRYRGEYYHAHDCAEFNPPALTQRQVRASPTST
jgi:hypothetical protein